MPLSSERRKQLDDIVVKMAEQNAPQEDVQSIVNDFTSKYGEEAPSASEAPKKQGGGVMSFLGSAGKTVGKGLADIVLQPARFIERSGKAIGTLGLSPEEKMKYEEFNAKSGGGLQEKVLGKEYATPAYKNAQEVAGGAIQTAANLATPAIGGVGGLIAQGAAVSGGKSLEEGKDVTEAGTDALIGGAISGATAGLLKGAGKVVEKGVKAVTNDAAREVVKKTFPFLTNISKNDTKWATENAYRVVPKMKAVAEAVKAGEDSGAIESTLRSDLLNTAKNVFSRAKQTAEKNYDDAVKQVVAKNPTAKGSLEAMRGSVRALAKEAGEAVTPDDEFALNALYKTIDNHSDDSVKGFIGLKRKLFPIIERTEQGSPARRLANLMYDEVDQELDRMTKGAMKPINQAYKEFKDAAFEVKPLWSEMAKEDTQRNFVAGLGGQAKTGSMAAIKKLEQMANTGDNLAQEIRATRIAKAMNWEKAPTGSRMRDILISNLIGAPFAAVGGALAGVPGAIVGQGVGAGVGSKLTSPQVLSKYLFEDLTKQGVKLPGEVQQAIGKALQNPQFMQVLIRAIGENTAPQSTE